ncbi:MAG: riboflavin synthase [Bacteroidetes bacterium TMED39]|nr:MAG: riboflavin synthase [Bacteroidetes bacterium TMED39]
MFTGIVETIGTIAKIETKGTNKTFFLESVLAKKCRPEQSILHDGVCLTVESLIDKKIYQVTAVEETLKKTNLGYRKVGDKINLEQSLSMEKLMDGHLVQGHVDLTALCIKVEKLQGSWLYHFELSEETALIVPRGSIAINGVSLTIAEIKGKIFTVTIIPYTYENTNFFSLKAKDAVNIEFDIIGKYVLKQLQHIPTKK